MFCKAIELLSSTLHRDSITNPLAEAAVPAHREALLTYPYALSDFGTRFLQGNGITVPGTAFRSHPHPIHKTFEIFTLQQQWRHLATTPSTVMYMKREKFINLQRLNPMFRTLFNQVHTPRDITRYSATDVGPIRTPTAFMHDAIMYIKPGQIIDLFDKSPDLQRVYASLVLPAESNVGVPSFNPDLYTFSVNRREDRLYYSLERSADGAYEQPLSALVWLRIHEIVGPHFRLSVELINTYGPFHTIVISRAPARPATRRFTAPECYLLPNPLDISVPVKNRLVPKAVYDGVFLYARAVRTLRLTDPAGYVRTQSQKDEYKWVTNASWDYLVDFINKTAMYRPERRFALLESIWHRLSYWVQANNWLLKTLGSLFGSFGINKILNWSDQNRISHLRLFGRVPINDSLNPLLVWRRALPRWVTGDKPFNIHSEARFEPAQIIRAALPAFITDRFPQWRPRLHLKPVLGTVAIVAGVTFAIWFATREYNAQCRSDAYNSYLHPNLYHLEWQTVSIDAEVEPFFLLPLCDEPPTAGPPPATDSGNGTGSEIPSDPNPNEDSSDESAPVPPSNQFSHPISLNSPVEAAPRTPPGTVMQSLIPRLQALQRNNRARRTNPFIQYSPEASDHEGGDEMEEPAPPLTRPLDPEATVFAPPVAPGLPPIVEEEDAPEPLSLSNDPSAIGPIKPARSFWKFPDHEGHFHTRAVSRTRPKPAMISHNCLLTALAPQLNCSPLELWDTLCKYLPDSLLVSPTELQHGLSTDHLELLCALLNFQCLVQSAYGRHQVGCGGLQTWLTHLPGHWETSRHRPAFQAPSREKSKLLSFLTSNPEIPARRVYRYHMNKDRASNLASNMKNGFDGILGTLKRSANYQAETVDHWSAIVKSCANRSVDFTTVLGFPGCGKSYPVQKALRNQTVPDYLVITPSTALRNEWKEALNLGPAEVWRVSTWETALTHMAPLVIIDEIFLLPSGYIDLVLALNPNIQSLIVLGDPLQNDYHSTNLNSTNAMILPERRHLAPYFDVYSAYTRRLPKAIASKLGVYTSSTIEGSVSIGEHRIPSATTLVPSRHAAATMNQNGTHAYTASGSQGLTFNNKANIILDSNWNKCSPNVSLVAATRSRKGVHFVRATGFTTNQLLKGHPAFNALLSSGSIDYVSQFARELGQCQIIRHPDEIANLGRPRMASVRLVGASNYSNFSSNSKRFHRMTEFKFDPYHARGPRDPTGPRITSNYVGDVVLNLESTDTQPQIIPTLSTTHLPEARRPLHIDIACALPEPVEYSQPLEPMAPCEPVYPGYNYELLIPSLTRKDAPADLEIRFKNDISNQFPTIDKEYHLGAETLEVVAPNHNSKKDPTLLPASIAKRLRFRSSPAPAEPSSQDYMAADLLYTSYCDALKIDPFEHIPFDEAAFIDCINENEFAQLSSKTKATILANANRSEPGWRQTFVRIFAKTQHKVNDNSIFGDWKACQTLALMHDSIILAFGPVKKYQRLMLERHGYNPKIFVYAGKSPTQLGEFVRKNFKPDTYRCWNDFSAFDQSQGLETTLFEAKKMQRVSIPNRLIQLHVFIKTRIECQYGGLTSMRLTGEPGTYDDNTDYNIAISNLRYNIRELGGLFSGDDSAFPSILAERTTWGDNSRYFSKLAFKTETGRYATFCGYYVGAQGAVRCPRPLVLKLMMAKDNGTLPDKLASYVAEFSVGHALGEDLWRLLPIEEVPYQSGAFDFICRHAPREMKVALHIGTIPDDVIAQWPYTLTRPLFAMLNRSQRIQYLKTKAARFASWASSFMPSQQ